jgi:hypothetical protein
VKGSKDETFYITGGKLRKNARNIDLVGQDNLEKAKVISDKLLELIPRENIK